MPKLTKKLSITDVRTDVRAYGRTDPNYRKASLLKRTGPLSLSLNVSVTKDPTKNTLFLKLKL